MEEGTRGPLARVGGLSLDKLFAWVPEFLVTPLLETMPWPVRRASPPLGAMI